MKRIKRYLRKLLPRSLVIILIILFIFLDETFLLDILKSSTESNYDEPMWHYASDTESFEAVQLVRIIDGDTIVVKKENGCEEKVRLLEVDAPENVASQSYLDKTGKTNSIDGKIASDFTKEQLAAYDVIYLEYDQEKYDKYGRTLAYVWLNDDVDTADTADIAQYCFNAILLKYGMAECVIYEPNHRYENVFVHFEDSARKLKLGIWK